MDLKFHNQSISSLLLDVNVHILLSEIPYMDLKIHNQLFDNNFSKDGSPGQTTMLTRRASKFCEEPRSPFSNISHQDPETIGKPPNIVPWPECRPEFPKDAADDDDDAPTVGDHFSIWPEP